MLVNLLLAFSNLILSLPFTIFGLSKFSSNELGNTIAPPGYVFGIVWSVLYLIFGIINLTIIYSPSISKIDKGFLLSQSLFESLLQTLWLLVTSNIFGERLLIQNILGLLVMYNLVHFAFKQRRPIFAELSKKLFYLYTPYTLWIMFAFILNLQLVINKLN